MKKRITRILGLFLLLAFNTYSIAQVTKKPVKQQTDKAVAQQSQQHVGINLEYMDTSVRPQDDFYNYVNGNWMKTAEIPADKSNWGSFNILRENTDLNSLKILNKILSTKYDEGSEGKKIQAIYNTFVDIKKRNADGITPIQSTLNKIDQIKNLKDLQAYLNEATLSWDNPLYQWYVQADMKNSTQNAVYFGGPRLGLGRDYYQKNTPENNKVLDEYTKYVAKLLAVIGYKDAGKVAKEIVAYEKSMAKYLLTNEEARDANKSYNPKTIAQLAKLSKNINLPQYLTNVGVQTNMVIADENNYLTNLDRFINNKNLDLVKNYLKLKIVASSTKQLDERLDQLSFDFYSKYLQGQQVQRSLDKRSLELVNGVLGEAFGKYYVEEYFPKEAKAKMKEMVDYVIRSFGMHIQKLDWMSQSTKEKALEKLGKFTVKIAYPDKWKDYSKLHLKTPEEGGALYENLLNVSKWSYQRDLEKVGKPVDRTRWGMSPQTVNAYYNPVANEIVFPAAILQPPFFDFKADPAINFGGIVAVIGHEISHGFDDSGSMFDGNGNLNNWWTKEDRKNFDLKVEQLAKQFDQYEVAPGIHVNGKFTSGENIGDLGGVAVAYDALQMYLKDKGNPGLINNFTQNQRFFMSWATIWRTKSTQKYLINQVKTDPHSPGQFRATGPIVNTDAFHESFNIKQGDKMYKAPNDRIKIW